MPTCSSAPATPCGRHDPAPPRHHDGRPGRCRARGDRQGPRSAGGARALPRRGHRRRSDGSVKRWRSAASTSRWRASTARRMHGRLGLLPRPGHGARRPRLRAAVRRRRARRRTRPCASPRSSRSTAASTRSAPRRSTRRRCTRAGHRYPGHTELLADLTGTPEVSMMLVDAARAGHPRDHPHRAARRRGRIEPGLVFRTIQRGHEPSSRRIAHPRIGSAGSTPTPARTGCSATARRRRRSRPASRPPRQAGIDVVGPAARRHALLPRRPRRLRPRRRDVPRPGPRAGEGARLRGRRERHRRPPGDPHLGRPRHGVRHRRHREADHRSMVEAIRQAVELAGAR